MQRVTSKCIPWGSSYFYNGWLLCRWENVSKMLCEAQSQPDSDCWRRGDTQYEWNKKPLKKATGKTNLSFWINSQHNQTVRDATGDDIIICWMWDVMSFFFFFFVFIFITHRQRNSQTHRHNVHVFCELLCVMWMYALSQHATFRYVRRAPSATSK